MAFLLLSSYLSMIIVTISMIKMAMKTSIFSDKNVEKFVRQGADFFGALSTIGTFSTKNINVGKE